MFKSTIFYITLIFINKVYLQDFGYDGEEGPNFWGQKYHQCIGKHQSPIDIEEHDVEMVNLPMMIFENFDIVPDTATIKNNGHTVVMAIKTNDEPKISGGPLVGTYKFKQLHFHWGANDDEGSENLINNSSFPLELHMVFYRESYGSFEEANDHPDGLVVLSFLYSNSAQENKNYKSFLKSLSIVKEPFQTAPITLSPTLNDLTFTNRTIYFTYGGSLTTPPCSEVVTWIEFKNTVPLHHNQIELFRLLKDEHGKLTHNFRPVQPLHGRIIRMNISSSFRFVSNILMVVLCAIMASI